MIPLNRHIPTLALFILVIMTTTHCTSKNYLVVNYRLPSETAVVEETEVSLIFEDQRGEQAIVSQNAKEALEDFSGNFALIVAGDNKDEQLIGAFSLSSMIKTIFKQRLEHAGIRVAPEDQNQPTAVEIILKEFKLDLVKQKWIVQMAYQANLLKDGRFVAGETVTGNAERLRVVASKDAEMILGELITDAVNRLNLDALFQSGSN
jgi:uncharacterized lipoprotein YajG